MRYQSLYIIQSILCQPGDEVKLSDIVVSGLSFLEVEIVL